MIIQETTGKEKVKQCRSLQPLAKHTSLIKVLVFSAWLPTERCWPPEANAALPKRNSVFPLIAALRPKQLMTQLHRMCISANSNGWQYMLSNLQLGRC